MIMGMSKHCEGLTQTLEFLKILLSSRVQKNHNFFIKSKSDFNDFLQ